MKNSLNALALCILIFFLLPGCQNPLFNSVTAELDYITVTRMPVTLYEQNEPLDITGLEVTGTYTDGKTKRESVALNQITGYNSAALGTQRLTVTVGGKTAMFTVYVAVEKLKSISVTSRPDKTEFGLGEDIDLTGLVVTGYYADNSLRIETITPENISGYDKTRRGRQNLTVTVNGKTTSFYVTVTDARLVSIAITAPPSRTDYWYGEELDLTGLEVIGTYTDGGARIESITMSNISGYNRTLHGEQIVTVTINGFKAVFTVSVVYPSLISIEITSPPNKTVYVIDEVFETTGIAVTGTYSDGSTKPETVTLADISGYNPAQTGEQLLTVIMETPSGMVFASFTVTVCKLDRIIVSRYPSKLVYTQGESFDSSGIEVQGIYIGAGISTERIISESDLNFSGFSSSQTGIKTVTVSAYGKTTNFIVFVDS